MRYKHFCDFSHFQIRHNSVKCVNVFPRLEPFPARQKYPHMPKISPGVLPVSSINSVHINIYLYQWFSTGVPRLKLKGSAGLLANIDVNTPEIGNTMFSNLLTTM